MVMSQFQHSNPWQLRSYSGSQPVVVMETAATNGAAAKRVGSSVSQHALIVKTSYARNFSMMIQSGEDTDLDY